MSIVVGVKRVYPPLYHSGTAVTNWTNNPFDEVAVERALCLRGQPRRSSVRTACVMASPWGLTVPFMLSYPTHSRQSHPSSSNSNNKNFSKARHSHSLLVWLHRHLLLFPGGARQTSSCLGSSPQTFPTARSLRLWLGCLGGTRHFLSIAFPVRKLQQQRHQLCTSVLSVRRTMGMKHWNWAFQLLCPATPDLPRQESPSSQMS